MKRSRGLDEDNDPASPATPSSISDESPAHSYEAASPPPPKIAELDPTEAVSNFEMRCSLPPHREPVRFGTYEEYEAHYHKTHTNRCLECHKNFPSTHLLSVHTEEMHDPFAQVLREKGERTYSCFVEGCDRKCSTPQKRRMHLIDKHMYPKNFFFAVTKDGIDGRRSMLLEGGHRRRSSAAAAASVKAQSSGQATSGSKTATQSTDDSSSSPKQKPDAAMEGLTGAMSALQFVPPSIRFGRGGRAGFAKR
ncbi:hypothetical protein B0T14DRAFT_564338 [Immersiella caudata]|uniref:C2H2-type domain-containing protein n=1 Tax=Immersiella caudata TaxID=314043 RepID=A0AA40C2S3_9PEZI|nr:hypothetical protein B0T14DRAFT_564338 [Immersiella caudata]